MSRGCGKWSDGVGNSDLFGFDSSRGYWGGEFNFFRLGVVDV